MARKKDEPFNSPFSKLQLPEKSKPVPVPAAPRARPQPTKPADDDDEAALFREMVGEVRPLRAGGARSASAAADCGGARHSH